MEKEYDIDQLYSRINRVKALLTKIKAKKEMVKKVSNHPHYGNPLTL